MTAPLARCTDCRKPLRRPPKRDEQGRPYGPDCARDRGLTGGRTVRVGQPVRTGGGEPVLDGLEELMETEANEESEEQL